MKRLRSLGVSLAIRRLWHRLFDCLGYLPGLPFTALKIDRTFVRRLHLGPEVATMNSVLD